MKEEKKIMAEEEVLDQSSYPNFEQHRGQSLDQSQHAHDLKQLSTKMYSSKDSPTKMRSYYTESR